MHIHVRSKVADTYQLEGTMHFASPDLKASEAAVNLSVVSAQDIPLLEDALRENRPLEVAVHLAQAEGE